MRTQSWICQICEDYIEDDEVVWVDPKTGAADQENGFPYHVECAPPQHKSMTTADIATVILKAIDLAECSFNNEAYRCAEEDHRRKYPDYGYLLRVNPAEFYEYSRNECINFYLKKLNLDPELFTLIDLAFHWEGDLYDWAQDVLHGTYDF